ncbi:MAG: putative RND superfamily exporter protein, partial [Gammaproteobacteria bacterium]
ELIERLKAQLPEVAGNGASVVLSGTLVLYDNVLQSLFQSQYQTAGVVILGIGLMLCVLFRSVKVALVGLVPNVLAAALVLSVMGWFGLPLDMMTITMVAITLGIAVDDTIHYLYRFREECEQGASYPQALKRCHSSVGQAMLYTSAIVVLGFAIFAGSNFTPTIYFGLLTAVGMTLALLAALTLLPRLVVLVQPFGRAPV